MTQQTSRATRLIELERLLRRRSGGMTVAELSRELGRSPRTIQRDIQDLEIELRVPLVVAGRKYGIMPGAAPLAPVRLTLHEARAVFLATRLFLRFADERDPDGISAIEKLAQALPEPMAGQVAMTARELERRPPKPAQTAVLRQLTEGWATSRTLMITYISQAQGRKRQTSLDPYLLEPSATGAATYVIGYSHDHGAVRTFKVDRIESSELTDRRFETPDLSDLAARLAQSWGGVVMGESEEQHDIVVDFTAEVAGRISETNWHASQSLTPLPGGGVRLQLRLPSLLEFVPWVRSWGHAAHVVAPEELRRQVAESLRRAASQYGAVG